jgi:hypothetical protein
MNVESKIEGPVSQPEVITLSDLVIMAGKARQLVEFHNRLRDSGLPMFEAIVARTWTLNTGLTYFAALTEQHVDWYDDQAPVDQAEVDDLAEQAA